MSEYTTSLKEKTRRFFEEVFPQADDVGAAELVHEDVFDHSAPPGAPQGLGDVTRTMRWLNSVFSDLRWEIHQMIAEGDTVAVHCTLHGKQTGDLLGIPPTGRDVSLPYDQILRYENGKAKERWAVRDDLAMMRQLGVMPEHQSNGRGN
jgi:predicted ester cyclase